MMIFLGSFTNVSRIRLNSAPGLRRADDAPVSEVRKVDAAIEPASPVLRGDLITYRCGACNYETKRHIHQADSR
jgi:hypothetical protein